MASDLHMLLPPSWETLVDTWLDEDIPSFDYGGYVVGEKLEKAVLLGKANGMLAGVPFFTRIFERLGCHVEWIKHEGDHIDIVNGNVHVAYVTGPARKILLGERTALNIVSRCSGIATSAREAKRIADNAGWTGVVAGTRKTTPGFRIFEKYSLLVGGVDTHRHDLSSMIMLKDNHITSCGNITNAVQRARQVGGFSLKIEVETSSQQDAEEACSAGADIVMLDNFKPDEVKVVARNVKEKFPNVLIEVSGGINHSTLENYFSPHIDILSTSLMIQSVKHIDFSLKIRKNL